MGKHITGLLVTGYLGTILLASSVAYAAPEDTRHDVQAFLSDKGLEFVAAQAPALIPTEFDAPPTTESFACMDFEQRKTKVHVDIERMVATVPQDGRLRLEMDVSGNAVGELYAKDIYACFGEVTCQDEIQLERASAVFEYELSLKDGALHVTPVEIYVGLDGDDLDIELSNCGLTGSVLGTAIGFAKDSIVESMREAVAEAATESIGPMLEETIASMATSEGSYSVALERLEFVDRGLRLGLGATLANGQAERAECVGQVDEAAPADVPGVAPFVETGESHLNLAVNYGLLNAALYSAWSTGALCVTDKELGLLGIEVPYETLGPLLSGFPVGTRFRLEASFSEYPRVVGMQSPEARLEVLLSGLNIDLHGERPDKTQGTLHIEADAKASVTLGVNPGTNALYAHLNEAELTRLVIREEGDAAGEPYDVARLGRLVGDHVLPELLHELGTIDLTGPVFSREGFALILRNLSTTTAYLQAGIDLFKTPTDDTFAPDTAIDRAPTQVTNPKDAVIAVSGSDGEIPAELLSYLVRVNGEEREPSFLRSFRVGERGKTATYNVEVAAMDLAGNVDATPASVQVVVDGVAPHVQVIGRRNRELAGLEPVELTWTMKDDSTLTEDLFVRAEVYKLQDPTELLSAKLVETKDLPNGSEAVSIQVEKPGIYRLLVHVTDAAGNESEASMLVRTPTESGGCSIGGTPTRSGLFGMALCILSLLGYRRRILG